MWYMGNAALDRAVTTVLTRAGDEHILMGAADVAHAVNIMNADDAERQGRENHLVEVTPPQVHRSVRRIRMSRPDVPLVMLQQGRWSGYAISNDRDWVDQYRGGVMANTRTRVLVLQTNLDRDLATLRETDPARATRIRAHVEGLLRELSVPI